MMLIGDEPQSYPSYRDIAGPLVFGRLNRHQCALEFARELAELAEKDAAELRQLISLLVYQLKS